jgi:hypothetical protein
VVPGFHFDSKRKRASFEVTLPGTKGRLRRRKTVKASTRDEAISLFRKFRAAVLAQRLAEPRLFCEYVARFWPLIRMRLGPKTAAHESAVVEKILNPFFNSYPLEKILAAKGAVKERTVLRCAAAVARREAVQDVLMSAMCTDHAAGTDDRERRERATEPCRSEEKVDR